MSEPEYVAPRSSFTLSSILETAPHKARKAKKRRCPVCDEEFLEKELQEHVELCLTRSNELENELTERSEVSSELPEELLDSLLQLELSPAASEVFWSGYEFSLHRGVQQAFLSALEQALAAEELPSAAHSAEELPAAAPFEEACFQARNIRYQSLHIIICKKMT